MPPKKKGAKPKAKAAKAKTVKSTLQKEPELFIQNPEEYLDKFAPDCWKCVYDKALLYIIRLWMAAGKTTLIKKFIKSKPKTEMGLKVQQELLKPTPDLYPISSEEAANKLSIKDNDLLIFIEAFCALIYYYKDLKTTLEDIDYGSIDEIKQSYWAFAYFGERHMNFEKIPWTKDDPVYQFYEKKAEQFAREILKIKPPKPVKSVSDLDLFFQNPIDLLYTRYNFPKGGFDLQKVYDYVVLEKRVRLMNYPTFLTSQFSTPFVDEVRLLIKSGDTKTIWTAVGNDSPSNLSLLMDKKEEEWNQHITSQTPEYLIVNTILCIPPAFEEGKPVSLKIRREDLHDNLEHFYIGSGFLDTHPDTIEGFKQKFGTSPIDVIQK